MTGDNRAIETRLAARVVELETLLTHQQRTLAELDQVVLAQQKQIDALERRMESLAAELHVPGGSAVEERKPEDEKPPHY
jgi:SlyX protein